MAEGHVKNGENLLLAALEADAYKPLSPHLEKVPLILRQKLYKPNQPIEHVYFPVNGIVSMLAQVENGTMVEVATIGNEGLSAFLYSWELKQPRERLFLKFPATLCE